MGSIDENDLNFGIAQKPDNAITQEDCLTVQRITSVIVQYQICMTDVIDTTKCSITMQLCTIFTLVK